MGYIFTIVFVIGMIIGYAISLVKKPDGRFVIDMEDPERDLYSLEIDCDLDKLPVKRYITFKVINSHK